MNIKTITAKITEHRANGKVVRKSEYTGSTKVAITYADGSKVDMTADDFKRMHRVVEK
jgi:hypothetical protein